MYCANQRIAIYPVDSVIQPLNSRGLITNALSRLIFRAARPHVRSSQHQQIKK